MRLTRTITMLLSIMLVALFSVGVASAAPTKSPNAETFDLACDNGETYTLVVNGNGDYTPGHIISGDGRNLIPVAFTFEATDANGDVLFSESIAKKGQMQGLTGDLFTCTFSETFVEDGQTNTFVVTVTVFVVPRR